MTEQATSERALDKELKRLLVGTNEQRRRIGQTLWHFYRSLVFWSARGKTFFAVTQAWSAGGAAVLEALASTLKELPPHARDPELRAYVGQVLKQLAEDLERGDSMLIPFLRWLEGRFPELTAMMRRETADTAIHDLELAQTLAGTFRLVAGGKRAETIALLRQAAEEIVRPPAD